MADAAAPDAAQQVVSAPTELPGGAAQGAAAAAAASAADAGEPSGAAAEEQRKRELEEGETIAIKVTFGE